MSNCIKKYTVIDKSGRKHSVKGHYTKIYDNGFVAVIYKDRSGCVGQCEDVEECVFHEPAAVIEEKGDE